MDGCDTPDVDLPSLSSQSVSNFDLQRQISALQSSIDALCHSYANDKREQELFRESTKDKLLELTDNIKIEFTHLKKDLADLQYKQEDEISKANTSLKILSDKQTDLELQIDALKQTQNSLTQLRDTLRQTNCSFDNKIRKYTASFDKFTRDLEQLNKQVPQLDSIAIPEIRERICEIEDRLIATNDALEQAKIIGSQYDANHPSQPQEAPKEIRELQEQMAKLEDQSRRNNIIISGIPLSDSNERWETTEQLVQTFLYEKLEMDSPAIERAHRLNPSLGTAIIVKFQSSKDKEIAIQRRFRLTDTSYRLTADYSQLTKHKRRLLWEYAQETRHEEEKFSITHDKLKLGGQTYVCDPFTGQVSPFISRPSESTEQNRHSYSTRIYKSSHTTPKNPPPTETQSVKSKRPLVQLPSFSERSHAHNNKPPDAPITIPKRQLRSTATASAETVNICEDNQETVNELTGPDENGLPLLDTNSESLAPSSQTLKSKKKALREESEKTKAGKGRTTKNIKT